MRGEVGACRVQWGYFGDLSVKPGETEKNGGGGGMNIQLVN